MSKPVFVFVPGAWHSPDAYNGVIAGLESHGYSSVKVELPSVGGAPATYDFKEDVDTIISTVTKLVEQNKDVIVVGHSYSGQPVGEIPKELSKKERVQKQLKGGVIRLVFIMAFLVSEGFQAAPRDDISTMYWFMKADTKAGTVNVTPEDAKKIWYHDLPDEEANRWASKLVPQSIGVFWSQSTTAAWRYIPSTYILCDDDRSFTKPFAEMLIAGAKESGDHMLDTIEECKGAGHFVMLSNVDWTVGALRRAAGEKTE